jgi:hypothetical protein
MKSQNRNFIWYNTKTSVAACLCLYIYIYWISANRSDGSIIIIRHLFLVKDRFALVQLFEYTQGVVENGHEDKSLQHYCCMMACIEFRRKQVVILTTFRNKHLQKQELIIIRARTHTHTEVLRKPAVSKQTPYLHIYV